ncbi:hypothetical protein B0A48_02309 [Cryoendolithus antarcticus]|uniref:Gag1-like clamp domain-containing protein n=1 Tax=Cryoendolithus antarcticus TaxID=1507870 RepID=A0A1V8TN98_9PEZI|nr:hypothetical protein B0A48_02309 [Cryoendolithus antarcticus]
MTLHLGLPHHSRSAEQQEEIREARRLIKEKVRVDWEYPTLPAYQSSGRIATPATVGGFRFRASSSGRRDSVNAEALQWRERDYSSDEKEDEVASVGSVGSKSSKGSKKQIFKFEGPDSVGTEIAARKAVKRKRRDETLHAEMTWNDGLEHWIARRDSWCGAVVSSEGVRHLPLEGPDMESTSESAESTPRSSTSSSPPHSSSTGGTSPLPIERLSLVRTNEATTTLVPVMPLILPNHPVRRRLSPAVYPEIYSKIIQQSRTPSVPVNLKIMIEAAVRGWKDDGEWPPKPGMIEKSIGRKKGGATGLGLRDGVKAVGRVLRITGTEKG